MAATLTEPMIRRKTEDGVCQLTFDRPESGANIFDAGTMRDLDEQLHFIESDPSLRGVIITSAKKSIFIAGADLKTLLRQAQTGELRAFIAEGQRVFNRIAALKIPTVAAIHGACAGGGYEVTLACDWRVASNDPATKIGLPETTLGLVPAWGGTTRLPRLIGPEKGAEVILKGKLYSAQEAKQLGLVDEIVLHEQLLDVAKKKLRDGKKPSPYPLSQGEAGARSAPGEGKLLRAENGNTAPARALKIIESKLPVHESLAAELDSIVDLGQTDATQNLIRNFFLAEKYKKGSSKAPAAKILHAAVIGAGVMGSGIAQWLSSRGVSVILRDVAAEAIDRGLATIDKTYAGAVKRGLMSEEKAKEGRSRIVASINPGNLRDVQIVIEAASEKLEIKKKIFGDLAEKTPAHSILATNTSALPIDEIAVSSGAPTRVVGLHFFNPVSRMKLIEVVIGRQTSDEVRDGALAFARQIGKLPVLVRDSPGFLVNRVLFPYLIEAAEMFQAGINAEEIDQPLLEWGMPMGPLRLIDEIGVDITVDIADTLQKAFGRRDEPPQILRNMLAAKMFGRKSGAGFYKYEGKTQTANDEIEQWRTVIPSEVEGPRGGSVQVAPRDPSSALGSGRDDLGLRLVSLMVNEAARCVEEGVVATPEDADYGMILGTGFPTFRGGPLRFAEQFGIKRIVEKLDEVAKANEKFALCNLLRQHAKNGTKFHGD